MPFEPESARYRKGFIHPTEGHLEFQRNQPMDKAQILQVKPILPYKSETWRTTKTTVKKLQTFINSCLRQILNIHWPDTISNNDLWQRIGQQPVEDESKRRKRGWISHRLWKPNASTTRQVLRWNVQGTIKRGRPKDTWLRDLKIDIK